MPPRQRAATINIGNGGKDILEDMVAAIKEHVAVTNKVLQHLQQNSSSIGNNNKARNGDVAGANSQFYGLVEFKKAQPPSFRGDCDPVVVEGWLMQMEKIFEAMACTEERRVAYATYMLVGEAEHWWHGAKALLEAQGTPLTWDLFKATFLERYLPVSVRNQKEMEFLQLKQGNMTIGQYVSKFEKLSKFSSYLKFNPDKSWKAIKFESGLRAEIRNIVGIMEIRNYVVLVNKCLIAEQNLMDMAAEQQNVFKRKRENEMGRIGNTLFKRNQGRGGAPQQRAPIAAKCSNCGKNHGNKPCLHGKGVCYTCGKPGHVWKNCTQQKEVNASARPQTKGRVFSLVGQEAAQGPNMI